MHFLRRVARSACASTPFVSHPCRIPCLPLLPLCACSLSACAVAGILVGDIDKWNDPVLKRLNPEVQRALLTHSFCTRIACRSLPRGEPPPSSVYLHCPA